MKKTLSLDYLRKTKIDENLPSAQFNVEGYGIRARRDQDKYGGGLIECVWIDLMCKRLREITTLNIVNVCALNLLLPIKSGYALVSTDRLIKQSFNVFRKTDNISKQNNAEIWKSFYYGWF